MVVEDLSRHTCDYCGVVKLEELEFDRFELRLIKRDWRGNQVTQGLQSVEIFWTLCDACASSIGQLLIASKEATPCSPPPKTA